MTMTILLTSTMIVLTPLSTWSPLDAGFFAAEAEEGGIDMNNLGHLRHLSRHNLIFFLQSFVNLSYFFYFFLQSFVLRNLSSLLSLPSLDVERAPRRRSSSAALISNQNLESKSKKNIQSESRKISNQNSESKSKKSPIRIRIQKLK